MASSFSHEDLLPDVALGDVQFPRARAGNAPQSLAVMLMAEFGLRPRAWFPSAAVVALLTDFGTTTVSSRAVVNRLARRGVLDGGKQGRRTRYRLTEAAAAALVRGGHALATFPEKAEAWDGAWTIVAFSVPKDADSERSVLRARLRWRGFMPLYDGLWVCPQEPGNLLDNVVAGAVRSDVSIFRAHQITLDRLGTRDALALWNMPAIADDYASFLDRWAPLVSQVHTGTLSGATALRARVEVEDDYRRFVVTDPRLPLRVMPRGWPRAQAREVFAGIYDGLAEPALAHVRDVVARCTDGPRPEIRAYTTADLSSGVLLSLPEAEGVPS